METVLGTWQTAPSDGFWTKQDTLSSERTISCAVRHGIKTFDCAQSYGKGRAEQILAKVLSRFPGRSFNIDTKIMPSSKSVRELVEKSLVRLRLTSLNRLYLHWPSSLFDWEDMLVQMHALKSEGLIKRVGVCNLSLSQLRDLCTRIPVDTFQRPFSLLWNREFEETKAFCRENGMELAVYSPLGAGLLSGRYRTPADFEDNRDRRKDFFCFNPACSEAFLALLNTPGFSAENALRWVAARRPDLLLLGCRNEKQLEANLSALESPPDAQTDERLTRAADTLCDKARGICDNMFSYNWDRESAVSDDMAKDRGGAQ